MAFRPFITNLLGLDGTPESGGLLQSYVKDTTTPLPLYSDAGVTPRTNPIVAESLGQVTAYFNDALSYSWQAKTADNATTLWRADVVAGVLTLTFVNPDYDVFPIVDLAAVRSTSTYAALTGLMAATGLIDGAVYVTKARSSADDGGHGQWRYDAASVATANGGTILAIDGGGAGRFFRLGDDITNVRHYIGAVGSTSETAFVAAAARTLSDDAGTGVVFVPRGTVYAIDNNPSPVANVGFFQISPRYQGDTSPSWMSDGTLYGDADEPSNVWVALEGRFDRGSTTEDDTQVGLFVGVHGDTSSSDVSYIKMAAYFRYRLNDPSDYVAAPDINRDGVAMGAFAVIAAGNAYGRAWAGYFDIRVEATGDGIANGIEVDCFNAGTTQTALNTTTSKYGVITYASSGHFTAAFYANYDSSSGSNEFEYAFAANPSAIATSGYFLFLDSLFGVKPTGQTSIGTTTPRASYTLTLDSAATTGLAIVSDGANESLVGYVDTGTTAWATGLHNTSAEWRIANGENLGSSVALAVSNTSLNASFGGNVSVASGKVYKVNGTQVVAAQGAAVSDALTGGSATAADCATQLNLVLARLRSHGLIAT